MMVQKLCGLALIFVGLASCSTPVEPPLTYYRLDDAAPVTMPAPAAPTLVLDRIDVADFLKQTGLVMQLGNNELQISRQHRWAEPLDQALPRHLQQTLQAETRAYRVLLKGADFISQADLSLRVQINSFHVLGGGEALLSGQYQLIDEQQHAELKADSFRLVGDLQQDGYPHAVQQLQQLLATLAARIEAELPVQ